MSRTAPDENPRFTEAEYVTICTKLATIFACIEAQWDAIAIGSDKSMRGRHLDAINTLAQVGGWIADHAAEDSTGYGDIFEWLEIPEGAKQ